MARLTKDQIISNIYYDLDEGVGSKQATHKKAKEEDATITLDDVKPFLNNNQIDKSRITEAPIPIPRCLPDMNIKQT